MTEDQQNIEWFERYRNGDLDKAEQEKFEARLSYDADFRDEFEQYKAVEDGVKTHFRNELKTNLKSLDKKLDAGKSTAFRSVRYLIWSTSIAAVITIGVFAFNFFKTPGYSSIANKHWPQEEGLPVKMSTKSDYDKAMNAFKQGAFEEAEKELLPLNSDTAFYFLGVISYKKEEYNQAKLYLKKLDTNSTFYDIGQFRLALTYLKQENPEEAKKVLEKIGSEKALYSKEAEAVLVEME